MPIYTYRSLENDNNYELFHPLRDYPLSQHPTTGELIQPKIVAGTAIQLKGLKRSTVVNKASPAATACGCAKKMLRSYRGK